MISRALSRLLALTLLAVLATFAPTGGAGAQRDQGIAAIVNDDVISFRDLNSRMSLFLATSNLEDTPENRRRLAPEVLRTLIDDVLKRQEMRKQNVTVSQAEIDRALAQIAQQVRVQPGELSDFLAARGVGMATLIEQLEVEIGWQKAVARLAGDRAVVSPSEVDQEMERLRQNADQVEYRLGEIFLAVDDPSEQARIEELALRLVSEVRGGANFAALARTFSQGPSAAAGGDLGWVPVDELDPQVAGVVARLQEGQVSDPIRAQGGYFILLMAGRRTPGAIAAGRTSVSLQQVFLPLPRTATEAQVSAQAKAASDLSAGASSCRELEERARAAGAAFSATPGLVDIQQLPPDMRQLVAPLPVNQPSRPVRISDGFAVLMVCERQQETTETDQRAMIERRLREQRLSAAARRQLRDLRRTALLDIRG